MKELVNRLTEFVTESPRIAPGAAAATTTTGAATYFEQISPIVGVLASSAGLILTCVLIWVNVSKEKRARKEAEKRLEMYEKELSSKEKS